MLNKLVDISQGKWSSVHGPSANKGKKVSSVGPKSLNISIRRKENERIERENHAFAKRLFQNTGSISKQKLDEQYKAQVAVKNRIQRVKKPLPNLNGRATLLPPLENSAFKTSKRSFSVKHRTEQNRNSDAEIRQMMNDQSDMMIGSNSDANPIPINNMYEGEEERKAEIPPPLDSDEEAIQEMASEQVHDSTRPDDIQSKATGEAARP